MMVNSLVEIELELVGINSCLSMGRKKVHVGKVEEVEVVGGREPAAAVGERPEGRELF